jgi:replication-associated recombination protein RarA
MATHQACQVIGMPECRLNLAVSSIPVEYRETADEQLIYPALRSVSE